MSIVARGLGLTGGSLVAGGLGASAPAVLVFTGNASLGLDVGDLFAVGYCGVKAKPAVGGGGGNFAGRDLPHPLDLVKEVRRERVLDSLGMRIIGNSELESAAGEVEGSARIKRLALVAVSADVESCCSEVEGVAEFVDAELEMLAMLLAA